MLQWQWPQKSVGSSTLNRTAPQRQPPPTLVAVSMLVSLLCVNRARVRPAGRVDGTAGPRQPPVYSFMRALSRTDRSDRPPCDPAMRRRVIVDCHGRSLSTKPDRRLPGAPGGDGPVGIAHAAALDRASHAV